MAIVTHLVVEAWPGALSEFLLDIPRERHDGRRHLARHRRHDLPRGVSLAVAAPVGVLAAVYLNEYAPDNWFTRIINLAVVNLAGVPSIVHALFGLGAFVLFVGTVGSILSPRRSRSPS